MMNELNNDKNLREAVNRREQQLQPMSDDLNDRLLQRLEEEQAPAKHHRLWLYAAVAAAACIALLFVFHFTQEQSSQQPVVAQQMEEQAPQQTEQTPQQTEQTPQQTEQTAEVTESVEAPQPVLEEPKQAMAKADAQPVRKSNKKQRKTVMKLVELIPTAEGEGRDMASAEPTTEAEFSFDQDPLVAMAEHVQNIRSRGKRLQQAIEYKIEH
jgi:type IV secretory pathway VirB10-like protein